MSSAAQNDPDFYAPDHRLSQAYDEATLLDDEGLEALCPSYIELAEIDTRYRDGEPFGQGAVKDVYRTYDCRTQRWIAMARLRHDRGPEFYDVFVHEAWLTSSLSHPNIIKVHDAGVDSMGRPFFTMDLKGTPGYMAPEQVVPKSEKDQRTDIFSLGCILHLILTGHPPFTGTRDKVLDATIRANVAPPRLRYPHLDIPESLQAVIMKATARNPDERYQTSVSLQQEIHSYLDGYSTSAEESGLFRESLLFGRRNRTATAISALALVVITVLTVLFVQDINRQRLATSQERERASQLQTEAAAIQSHYDSLVAQSEQSGEALATKLATSANSLKNLGIFERPVQTVREARELADLALALDPACDQAHIERFSLNCISLTGLTTLTRYYYRFRATNTAGETWASTSNSFVTRSDNPSSKPNLLIIYADDMGFSDLAAYGPLFGTTSAIPTPRMDALASQGMMFTQAHSCSGVCTPSRYGILTGRYHWRLAADGVLPSGIVGAYGHPIIQQGELTIADFLRSQGYTTAAFGKWHLGAQYFDRAGNPFSGLSTSVPSVNDINLHRVEQHAVHLGFDHFFGCVDTINRPPYAYMRDDKILFNGVVPAPGTHPWTWTTGYFGPAGPRDATVPQIDYSPDMIDEAVSWLSSRAAEPDPFFAYVSLYSPHKPHFPTPAFQGSVGFNYGDFVHETDHWIGRVLDAIDNNPTLANTIVVLTSDNGPETSAFTEGRSNGHDANGPFRGVKRDSWEGGTRVPFIVRWPGTVAPGTISNELVWQGDIFSTIAAVLGADLTPNDSPDGESFLNVIRGQPKPAARRDSIVIGSIDNQLALKTIDGWKLVDGTGGGGNATSYNSSNANIASAHGTIGGSPKQLFNLTTDLGENNNLQATETAKRDELLARLAIYRNTPTSNVPPPDNDLDGMSNAFENTHGFAFEDPADGLLDADSDTLSNATEAQYNSNPHNTDSDDDKLGDATEVNTLGTRPDSPHSDPDILTDGDEVLLYSTDPLLADTDGDGLNDDDELAAGSNPSNAASHPVLMPPVTTTLSPSSVQLAGINGTVNDPQALGDTAWPEASALHVRERSPTGSSQERRTRLFLSFDLSGITDPFQDARLRLHQTHRLNNIYSASLEAARVLDPWSTTVGNYPTFTGTSVADNFVFGANNDFGTVVDASGFYSGTLGIPGTDDSGFDPSGNVSTLVGNWLNGTHPNHGIRIAFSVQDLVGATFSATDDPATPTLDESPALLVTTRATSDLDTDDDHLPDAWELDQFTNLTAANSTSDFDLDGASDLLELALGSNPKSANSFPALSVAPSEADPDTLELRFLRSRDAALGFRLEQSPNLSSWSQALGTSLPLSPSSSQDLGNGYDELCYTLSSPLAGTLFLRITLITP